MSHGGQGPLPLAAELLPTATSVRRKHKIFEIIWTNTCSPLTGFLCPNVVLRRLKGYLYVTMDPALILRIGILLNHLHWSFHHNLQLHPIAVLVSLYLFKDLVRLLEGPDPHLYIQLLIMMVTGTVIMMIPLMTKTLGLCRPHNPIALRKDYSPLLNLSLISILIKWEPR